MCQADRSIVSASAGFWKDCEVTLSFSKEYSDVLSTVSRTQSQSLDSKGINYIKAVKIESIVLRV
jgi:hypothetical protein